MFCCVFWVSASQLSSSIIYQRFAHQASLSETENSSLFPPVQDLIKCLVVSIGEWSRKKGNLSVERIECLILFSFSEGNLSVCECSGNATWSSLLSKLAVRCPLFFDFVCTSVFQQINNFLQELETQKSEELSARTFERMENLCFLFQVSGFFPSSSTFSCPSSQCLETLLSSPEALKRAQQRTLREGLGRRQASKEKGLDRFSGCAEPHWLDSFPVLFEHAVKLSQRYPLITRWGSVFCTGTG